MFNRKQLPLYGKIKMDIDVGELQRYCIDNGYTDYSKFNDIKYSSNSNHQEFLVGNQYCKESFFKEESEEYLEGELYKQLYLSDMSVELKTSSTETLLETSSNIFSRTRRLRKDSKTYVPETDELNYSQLNEHVTGPFERLIKGFKSRTTRIRLAALMGGMEIKEHVDYDPSYITRYHIPIFTTSDVIFNVKSPTEEVNFMMEPGDVWFLNTGYLHSVKNNSCVPRLHLIIDTHGQEDLNFV